MLVVTSNNPRLPFIAKHRKSLRHLRSPNNSKFNSKFFSSNSNRPFHRALLPQDLVVRLLLVRPPSLLSRHNSQSPRRQHDRKATLDSSLSDGLISQFLSLYTPRHSSWALANIFFLPNLPTLHVPILSFVFVTVMSRYQSGALSFRFLYTTIRSIRLLGILRIFEKILWSLTSELRISKGKRQPGV